jgi:hypothetical protein
LQLWPLFKTQSKHDVSADDQIPWVGAGVGIIMGVIIVIADHILTYKPTLVVSALGSWKIDDFQR